MSLIQNLVDYVRLNHHLYHDSPAKIAGRQQNSVMALVAKVRTASPFYRNLYAGYQVDNLQDFARLPTINKTMMMANFDDLNTVGLHLDDVMQFALDKEMRRDYLGYYRDRFVVGLSSGTSGNKGIYLTDRELTKRLPGVFLARGGIRLSDLPLRILFILRVFSQGFADINAPLIRLNYLPSMTEPEKIIETLNEMSANILMAPPSLLRQLLPLTKKIQKPPRRLITYAEVLEAEEKIRFAAAFQAPVVEIYQASEGQIGSPCRCGNLHINEDLVYVELLDPDGQPVTQPGQRATRMLVTNLVNTVQPLIRYEMNDIIELGDRCACGSNFRVISRIVGRDDDVLYLKNQAGNLRAVFPDLVSRWIITTDDRIREFTVEQTADNALTITLDLLLEGEQISKAGNIYSDTKSDTANIIASNTVSNNASIVSRLRQRLTAELAEFDITCEISILIQPIPLPADNLKMKRFRRKK